MIHCSVRTYGEGTCRTDECRASHPPKAKEAPIRFSVRDQLMVCAFVGVIAGFIFYTAGSMADEHYRKAALDCQERCVVSWKR